MVIIDEGVLNPHGSDETTPILADVDPYDMFLTHTVQMKPEQELHKILAFREFLTHTVQMKRYETRLNGKGIFLFLTHTVQMKH